MKQYISKEAQCPFYRKEDNGKIYCDGFADGAHLILVFDDADECRLHKRGYCRSIKGCEQCPVHKMLCAEYEENAP